MAHTIRLSAQWVLPILVGVCLLALFVWVRPAGAITGLPDPDPQPGSYGLEATKPQPPPKVGASISTPGNGGSYTTSPITVNGICPTGLLVQVYDNNVMVGSAMCANGSFSIQISLFAGNNDINAIVYDDLGQAGPTSNTNTVTYTNAQFSAFGALITLTSSYGRRSAATDSQLEWPLQLSGGAGPYAFSVDWGDGSPTDLKSQPVGGVVPIDHTYDKAGIYQTNVKVTDVNGVSAFLQVVSIASGKVDAAASANTGKSADTPKQNKVLWEPAAAAVVLLLPTFWLGRQSQVISLRNKMLKERDSFSDEP